MNLGAKGELFKQTEPSIFGDTRFVWLQGNGAWTIIQIVSRESGAKPCFERPPEDVGLERTEPERKASSS
jgi:hypothetical protein